MTKPSDQKPSGDKPKADGPPKGDQATSQKPSGDKPKADGPVMSAAERQALEAKKRRDDQQKREIESLRKARPGRVVARAIKTTLYGGMPHEPGHLFSMDENEFERREKRGEVEKV